jgi:alpha-L-rhamnosidase
VGGIAPLTPGFKTFEIAPKPGGGLTWSKTHYRSIHGLIRSEWEMVGDEFKLEVEVPVNTKGTVVLPEGYRAKVMLNGEAVEGTVELASGIYTITGSRS